MSVLLTVNIVSHNSAPSSADNQGRTQEGADGAKAKAPPPKSPDKKLFTHSNPEQQTLSVVTTGFIVLRFCQSQ